MTLSVRVCGGIQLRTLPHYHNNEMKMFHSPKWQISLNEKPDLLVFPRSSSIEMCLIHVMDVNSILI